MTALSGSFMSCGTDFFFSFTCTGPSCDFLNGWPFATCTTEGDTLTCSNGVACSDTSNFTSVFSYNQPNIRVASSLNFTFPTHCEEFLYTSDGTTGGGDITALSLGDNCNSPTVSSVTILPSSSSASVSSPSSSTIILSPSSSETTSSYSSTTSLLQSILISSATTPSPVWTNTLQSTSGYWSTDNIPESDAGHSKYLPSWMDDIGAEATPSISPVWDYKTSTIMSTKTYTLTSCPPEITDCFIGSKSMEVITSYSICSEEIHMAPSATHLEVYTTTYTITSCPSYEAGCKIGEVKTDVVNSYIQEESFSKPNTGVLGPYHGEETSSTMNAEFTSYATASDPTWGVPAQTDTTPDPTSSYTHTTSSISAPPMQVQTNAAQSLRPFKLPWLLCAFFALVSLFSQGINVAASDVASTEYIPSLERDIAVRNMNDVQYRSILDERGLIGDTVDLGKALIDYFKGKIPDSSLPDQLYPLIESVVCDWLSGKLLQKGAVAVFEEKTGIALLGDCVKVINLMVVETAPEVVAEPPLALGLELGSGLLCGYLVNKAFSIPDAVDAICSFTKPCTKDFMGDANNCGKCGNKCASGSCKNGACTNIPCTGQTCATFSGSCGPGSTCVCASTTEGTGFCVDGDTPCSGLADCSSSSNCAAGQICAAQTCCERSVCVGATFCGNSNGTTPARMLRRSAENATIANPEPGIFFFR